MKPTPCAAVMALLMLPISLAASLPDGYRDARRVEDALRTAARHREADLRRIGTSAGGRPLLVLRVASGPAMDADARPALFVGANIQGWHLAGTEAALDLVDRLLDASDPAAREALRETTFYIAPLMNPDALQRLAGGALRRASANDGRPVDADLDGLLDEDGFEDLDGDGWITSLRIPEAGGSWLPHPDDSRIMVRADPDRGWTGSYRLVAEGEDDDGDGAYNEDPEGGTDVARNFPMAFPHADPEAGAWPGLAPEAKAWMDFLLERRNLAAGLVYGPANLLLEEPRPLGAGGGDAGSRKFKPPERVARWLGLEPDREYTLDEVWEIVEDSSFVTRNDVTKDRIAQILGAGPATRFLGEDDAMRKKLAERYEERLEEAGLDAERPAGNWAGGGLTPWLYFHRGLLAIELDVWGVPHGSDEEEGGEAPAAVEDEGAPLTLDEIADMDAATFTALGEERIGRILEEAGAPRRVTAARLLERVDGGLEPERIVQMLRRMGAGADEDEDDEATRRAMELMAWVDAHAAHRFRDWSEVTLADGTVAEVGGIDPLLEAAPPRGELDAALSAHSATALDLAGRLPRLELLETEAEGLGGGVWRVRALVVNTGGMATHTAMARRARTHLPVLLELDPGAGAEIVTGKASRSAEGLEAKTGKLEGSWLVRGRPGAHLTIRAHSEQAGEVSRVLVLQGGAGR